MAAPTTLTFKDIQDLVLDQLQEIQGATDFTLTKLKKYINLGYNDFTRRTRAFTTSYDVTTVADQTSYSIIAGAFYHISHVRYIEDSSTEYGEPLRKYPGGYSNLPKNKDFGDISTNIALQLASQLKSNPRQIADEIKSNLKFDNKIIEKIEIAGPGFINFYIASASIQSSLNQVLDKGKEFGKSNIGNNLKTQVEFVSANPTGPLTIGHGRQAVLGDTIARLYEACGFDVTREYYFNNAGRQMRILGESVRLRYLELLSEKIDFPQDHYQGTYITDIAKEIHSEHGDKLKEEKDITVFKDKAEELVFADIKKTIARLKFKMDVFYNEK